MKVARRLVLSSRAIVLTFGVAMGAGNVSGATPEEQLKELQSQVAILQQQIQLANLQQTQAAATQTALLTALKGQVSAQSDLDKAKAQGDFAKLAGIKAGLDSVGAPLGKDGSITVTTGTAGALMLGLRKPMLEGLATSADAIVKATKPIAAGSAVFVATDAQIQAALQSRTTDEALKQAAEALSKSTTDVRTQLGKPLGAAALAEIAGVGLFLNTLVGLEKFFRVDTTYAVFESSDDAQQTLMLMLLRKLKDGGVVYRNLSNVSVDDVLAKAKEAQTVLIGLKGLYDEGAAVAADVDKMKSDDPKRPTQKSIDRLKADLGVVKGALDALHPALKPEGFWAYVQGRAGFALMKVPSKDEVAPRLVVSVKAQAIQVVEKRTWRSDKIFGKSDMQIEFRLLAPSGDLLDSGLTLATYSQDGETVSSSVLYNFP